MDNSSEMTTRAEYMEWEGTEPRKASCDSKLHITLVKIESSRSSVADVQLEQFPHSH